MVRSAENEVLVDGGFFVPNFEDVEKTSCPGLSDRTNWFLREHLFGQNHAYETFYERANIYGRQRVLVITAGKRPVSACGNAVFESTGEEMIYVTRWLLEEMAIREHDEVMELRRFNGEVVFVGTPGDYLFLVGGEEVHHHLHPEFSEVRSPAGLSVAEYDAIDAEFSALQFNLKTAIDLKFRRETVEFLRTRIGRANAIRRRLKK